MRAIIVDDDPNMHEVLPAILRAIEVEVEIVDTASNLQAGLAAIENQQPDLLFLDIDLGDGTGFDLLNHIDYGKYLIIFISGHSEYGRLALEFEAMAYLDKPLRAKELLKAVERATKYHEFRTYQERKEGMSVVLNNYQEEKLPTRLTITNSEGYHFLSVADILYLKGGRGITTVVMRDGRKVSKTKSLRSFQEQFELYPTFLKVHQNYLVNICEISQMLPGNLLLLPDQSEVKLSSESAQLLKRSIEELC